MPCTPDVRVATHLMSVDLDQHKLGTAALHAPSSRPVSLTHSLYTHRERERVMRNTFTETERLWFHGLAVDFLYSD